MATGIPGKAKHIKNASKESFRLEYEGKIPMEAILNAPLTELRRVLSTDKQTKNRLIYGENLRVLRNLLDDPDVVGKVGLIYIDPPYATGFGFESRKQENAYHDLIEGAAYLEFLRQRLILLDAQTILHLNL